MRTRRGVWIPLRVRSVAATGRMLEPELQAGLEAEVALGAVTEDEVIAEVGFDVVGVEEPDGEATSSLEIYTSAKGHGKRGGIRIRTRAQNGVGGAGVLVEI